MLPIVRWILIGVTAIVLLLKGAMLIEGVLAFARSGQITGRRRRAQQLIALHLCEPALTIAPAWLIAARVKPAGWTVGELFVNGVLRSEHALLIAAPIGLIALLPLGWILSADPMLGAIATHLVLIGALRWGFLVLTLLPGFYEAGLIPIVSWCVQSRFLDWGRAALARLRVREELEIGPPGTEAGLYVPSAR